MKRTAASVLIMIMIMTICPFSIAASKTDAGYDTLVALLSGKLGAPAESVDDSDVFSQMNTATFNTKKASNLAIFDLEAKAVTVFGKLDGRSAKMSIWQDLAYDVISEAGYLALSSYKEINSKSTERFAIAVFDSSNSLYIDTTAEANSGLKKYSGLFGGGQPAAPQTAKPTSVPTASPQSSGSAPTKKPSAAFNPSKVKKYFSKDSNGDWEFDYQCNASECITSITFQLSPQSDGTYMTGIYGFYYDKGSSSFCKTTGYAITIDGHKYSFEGADLTISFNTNMGKAECTYIVHSLLDDVLKEMRNAKEIKIAIGFEIWGLTGISFQITYSGNDNGLKTLKAMANALYNADYFNSTSYSPLYDSLFTATVSYE